MSRATECFSMYSDMSMRSSALSSSNRYSASALVNSVLPTPVGPRNMNEPIGRGGSCKPGPGARTEKEGADRTVRILQAGARAAHCRRDRLHGFGLPDDALLDHLLHAQELFLLALEHAVDRHAGPARDDLRDVVGRDGLLDHRAFAVVRLDRLQLFFKLGNFA